MTFVGVVQHGGQEHWRLGLLLVVHPKHGKEPGMSERERDEETEGKNCKLVFLYFYEWAQLRCPLVPESQEQEEEGVLETLAENGSVGLPVAFWTRPNANVAANAFRTRPPLRSGHDHRPGLCRTHLGRVRLHPGCSRT